ncbi:efflux RND transporter periplasmic adaptor subunit [Microvirga sp. W0021]|uniref:Efflux RND transporter periplasmic adaptor subunit n=1 Tax=Hohaiivirga grylli TaxID=3133970 RepID=A0ABV0BFR3_9HYPH
MPAPLVTVVRAEVRDLVESTSVTGTLVPFEEILVTPEVDGYSVVEVLVDEGAEIKKGQVLARLSRGILEAQIAQLDATIEQAKNQIVQAEASDIEAQKALQRTIALSKSGNTTDAQLEQRQSAARAAEGRLAAARNGLAIAEAQRAETAVKLDNTDIKAPEAGIISRKTARVGAVVSSANEPLFRIIANGQIELEADVPETQLLSFREGASALISIDDKHQLHGTVRLVYPEVDRKTRLGKVRIAVESNQGLHIGAFASATVELARQKGIAVPMTAVIYGVDGTTLQVIKDNKIETRNTKTGISGEGFIQILENLTEGEIVVARSGSFLQDGDQVRVFDPASNASGKEP